MPEVRGFHQRTIQAGPMTIGDSLRLEICLADDFPGGIFFAVHEFGAELDRQVAWWALCSQNPSARPAAGLKQSNRSSAFQQGLGCSQTRHTGADDNYRFVP